MKTETKKVERDGKVAEYQYITLDSIEELYAQFEGKTDELLKWASPNLPANRNEYQKARIATEPPIKALARAVLSLHKTGLAQFADLDNCLVQVPEEYRAKVKSMVQTKLAA
jgi:hypothetical protein